MPFESAPFGVIGLETAFAALYTHLVEPGELTLETLLERLRQGRPRSSASTGRGWRSAHERTSRSSTPRRSGPWTPRGSGSRSANSWLLGARLRGRIRATLANGKLVHDS